MGGFLLPWQTGKVPQNGGQAPKGVGIVTTRLQKKKGLALDEFQSQSLVEMLLSV